jgi:hypothetical protein
MFVTIPLGDAHAARYVAGVSDLSATDLDVWSFAASAA